MSQDGRIKIGIVAPGGRLFPALSERVLELAAGMFPDLPVDIWFHPQCFDSSGHFAGTDAVRAQAFLDVANDDSFHALWFGRGGYGSFRLIETVLPRLKAAANNKIFLGYSDAGAMLGALYHAGIGRIAHGPMPADLNRKGGDDAIRRTLAFLVKGDSAALEPSLDPATPAAAMNMTILSHLIGTPYMPDLAGHVLMLEEVSEPMYRIDRALGQITSTPAVRQVAGIRLGRCSAIPENDPDFGRDEEEVTREWCQRSGIPYLGRADIGHDIDNKIVPFGRWRP
ncbi:MAG: LD-carboxypeptidase [Rhodospirillaceae bacterium]|nr:LD-carboxypeptidase [Rhodospirillales bacterium]